MNAIRYMNTDITRTNSVCLSRGNKRLYALSGDIEKAAEVTPFLTSIRDAKEYIADTVNIREMGKAGL